MGTTVGTIFQLPFLCRMTINRNVLIRSRPFCNSLIFSCGPLETHSFLQSEDGPIGIRCRAVSGLYFHKTQQGEPCMVRPALVFVSCLLPCLNIHRPDPVRLQHIGEYIHSLDICFGQAVQILLCGLQFRMSEALLHLPDVDAAVQQ